MGKGGHRQPRSPHTLAAPLVPDRIRRSTIDHCGCSCDDVFFQEDANETLTTKK